MGELWLTDLDGDKLQLVPVDGFGKRRLSFFCVQDDDECGVALELADVVRVRDYLNQFISEQS